jgi:uncharacterized protein (DUF1786 family)
MSLKSLLALDIGGGTQDILLWRADQPIENAVKLVLPAPTQVAAARLRRIRAQGRNAFIHGWLMGGGPVHRATGEQITDSFSVYVTPPTAATFADDPARVEAMGIRIVEQNPDGAAPVPFGDLYLDELRAVCAAFEVELPDTMALAVCDHGFSPGYSNRKFRFEQWSSFLERGGHLDSLLVAEPPDFMTRLKALKQQAPGSLLMDTAAAAAWGALQDPAVARAAQDEGVCIVNLGNMHTVAFLVQGDHILAVYEHHTRCLDPALLADHIMRFTAGTLGDDEVFAGKGHGCARLPNAPTALSGPPVFTGPQRRMADGLGWVMAVPHGDVMLSGCFGLLAAAQNRFNGAASEAHPVK